MSVFWGRNGDMWEPQGGEHKEWRDLQPGDLIVSGRKVWAVREARLVPVIDWDEADRERYEAERDRAARAAQAGRPFPPDGRLNPGSEEEWAGRPLYLILVPASGGKRAHVKVRPYRAFRVYVLHPHYPVCRECGEPWPCPELDIKREVDRQSAELARLEKVMPGCCWCCGEPVTSRHKSVVFEGENLLLPGGAAVVFHLRRRSAGGVSCLSAAIGYEEKWVPAEGGRRWRLSCPGNVVRHLDGQECSELGYCPGPGAWHRGNVTSHRFTGTAEGEVIPVPGSGAEHCLRCQDAVAAGFYAGQVAEYLARKNGA